MFGQDKQGNLYCRDLTDNVNLVLMDPWFKNKNFFYYKFVHPITNKVKLIKR